MNMTYINDQETAKYGDCNTVLGCDSMPEKTKERRGK